MLLPGRLGVPFGVDTGIITAGIINAIFHLEKWEDGVNYTINRQPRGTHISEYTKTQRRWRHLTDEDLLELERNIEQRWKRLVYLAGYKSFDDGGQTK